mmetsp:Transcript_58254/g.163253  ORF Transcript_58254/g.163253 Transcript_58254/m.163253 type:complete len:120 (-) Transcript_58254:363-722(-)
MLSILIFAKSISSLGSTHMHTIPQRRQRIQSLIAYQIDRSTVATPTSTGSSQGCTLFSTKRDTPIASIASTHVHPCCIKELPFLIVFYLLTSLSLLLLSFLGQFFLGLNSGFDVGIKNL